MDLSKFSTQELIGTFFADTEDYSCMNVESFLRTLEKPTRLTKQDGVLFILMTKGALNVSAGYDNYIVEKGKLLLIQPNKPFSIKRDATELDGIVLYFKGNGIIGSMGSHSLIFNMSFLETWSKSVYTISEHLFGFIENIFKRIDWEKNFGESNLIIVNSYVITLLLELNSLYNGSIHSNRAAVELNQKFKKEVFNSLDKQQSIAEYANTLSVSPNYLNKCVKSVTGKSASNLLSQIKLVESKYLLMMSNTTVTEVAQKMGFEDTSYFSRFFKKYNGATPLEFRKKMIDLS